MGLDMYLTKKTYVKNWDYTPEEKRFNITIKQNGKKVKGIDTSRIKYVEEEVAYWRKANQIHNWFVNHIQDDDYNGNDRYISRELLEELLDTVNTVLKDSKLKKGIINNGYTIETNSTGQIVRKPITEEGKYIENTQTAESLLPTVDGFFFGSTDYDQYYIADLEYTKEILEKELKNESQGSDYYYSASW